jgi:hypothetical protein
MEVHRVDTDEIILNIWISSFKKCCVTKFLDDTDDDILCANSYFDSHNLKSDLE